MSITTLDARGSFHYLSMVVGCKKIEKKLTKSIKLNKNGSTVPAMANNITKHVCITKASTDRVLSMLNETAEKIASKIWQ